VRFAFRHLITPVNEPPSQARRQVTQSPFRKNAGCAIREHAHSHEDVRCCAGPKGRSRPWKPRPGLLAPGPQSGRLPCLIWCARGYALSYVAGDGAGTRSVAIGSVVCVFVVCVFASAILCCSPGHQVTVSPGSPSHLVTQITWFSVDSSALRRRFGLYSCVGSVAHV